jgi:hypothetical protein
MNPLSRFVQQSHIAFNNGVVVNKDAIIDPSSNQFLSSLQIKLLVLSPTLASVYTIFVVHKAFQIKSTMVDLLNLTAK